MGIPFEDEEERIDPAPIPIDDELFDPNIPNPPVFPVLGENITFLDTDVQPPTIVSAKVTLTYKTVQRKWPGWYNILRHGSGRETSVDLWNTRWKFTPAHEIPQIDGNYTLAATGNSDNSDMSRPSSPCEDQFIDDNISNQGSLFGDSHIEYLSNNLSESLSNARHEAFRCELETTLENDTGRAFRLVQRLNLELPHTGNFIPNKVYRLPPIHRLAPLLSVSEADISNSSLPTSRTPSAWHQRWQRLKSFLSRLSPFRKK